MRVTKITPEAVQLLVSYGIGCIDTLVKDGHVTPGYSEKLLARVYANEPLTENDARIFKYAYARCAALASEMGKDAIDPEVIRTYFFDPSQHNRYVDILYTAIKGFDPADCKAKVGTVRELGERYAVVDTDFEGQARRRKYGNHIRLRVGDDAVVHGTHIAEGLSKELSDLIKRVKSANAEQNELLRGVFKSKEKEKKARIKS